MVYLFKWLLPFDICLLYPSSVTSNISLCLGPQGSSNNYLRICWTLRNCVFWSHVMNIYTVGCSTIRKQVCLKVIILHTEKDMHTHNISKDEIDNQEK